MGNRSLRIAAVSVLLQSLVLAQDLPQRGSSLPGYPVELRRETIQRARTAIQNASSLEQSLAPSMASSAACDANPLPLAFSFADYTIAANGSTVIEDGGWTQAERDRISGFLCKMLPILEEIYGPPLNTSPVLYVKDLYYSGSNIYIPATNSIHSAGSWYPQLITHEFVHAFRGAWGLTADPSVPWNYSPKLSGFEEGFAQAVSYEAMNRYLEIHGPDEFVFGPNAKLFTPKMEWLYDFKNDDSMTCENFWSDSGGTLKYYERYEMAASAMRKLAIVIPDFYKRFNQEYYQKVQDIPRFQPSREIAIEIIASLSPEISGMTTADWIARQRILDCSLQFGKKVFETHYDITLGVRKRLFSLVETFPSTGGGGSEWYYYLPGQGYLYHRLNGTLGTMEFRKEFGASAALQSHQVLMKDMLWWTGYQACGVNCSPGFGAEELWLAPQGISNSYPAVANHVAIEQPSEMGLYSLSLSFANPHFSTTPHYGIAYDATTPTVESKHFVLAGVSYEQEMGNNLFGGIRGGSANGVIEVRHSSNLDIAVNAFVEKAAFSLSADPSWVEEAGPSNHLYWKPGILEFQFQPAGSANRYASRRIVDFGKLGAKQQILLDFEEMGAGLDAGTAPPPVKKNDKDCGLTLIEFFELFLAWGAYRLWIARNRKPAPWPQPSR